MSSETHSRSTASEEGVPDMSLDERLDEALQDSFPASDPPAIHPARDDREQARRVTSGP